MISRCRAAQTSGLAGPGSGRRRIIVRTSHVSSTGYFPRSLPMKIRLLSAALVAGLAATSVASAQEFDDRWYVSGSVGYNLQDEDRRTDDAFAVGLGLGKFISPQWSVE